MRSYYKAFRSPDFKTLNLSFSPGDSIEGWETVLINHMARLNAPFFYSFLSSPVYWGRLAEDFTVIDFVSGLDMANTIFDIRPYDEHPKN
jgi:hypothetical protein